MIRFWAKSVLPFLAIAGNTVREIILFFFSITINESVRLSMSSFIANVNLSVPIRPPRTFDVKPLAVIPHLPLFVMIVS